MLKRSTAAPLKSICELYGQVAGRRFSRLSATYAFEVARFTFRLTSAVIAFMNLELSESNLNSPDSTLRMVKACLEA